MIDLSAEPASCPLCGSTIADLEVHQKWHEHLDETIDSLSDTVVDTAAAIETFVDQLLDEHDGATKGSAYKAPPIGTDPSGTIGR